MANGKLELQTSRPGQYQLTFADGRKATVEVPKSADPIQVSGPWKINFPPGRGAPAQADFPHLADWTKNSNPGIKYFSGTATYHTTFNADAPTSGNIRWKLNLGKVLVMAEVSLNGKSLGVLWKQPFEIDVTDALRPGRNELEIKVTNLWPNRMIGDEQYPDDSSTSGSWTRGPLKAWPDWIKNHTPRPDSRRITFTTFKYYQKDSPLIPSGLLGPVTIKPVLSRQVEKSEP